MKKNVIMIHSKKYICSMTRNCMIFDFDRNVFFVLKAVFYLEHNAMNFLWRRLKCIESILLMILNK